MCCQAKARVLNSLLRFVKNTLAFSSLTRSTDADADLNGGIPGWIFRPSFLTGDAFNCFTRALSRPKEHDTKVYWQAMTDELAEADGADENGAGWDLAWLDDLKPSHSCTLEDLQVLDELEGKKSDEYLHCLDLSQLIHSVLVSTFLDVAPGVFTARDAIGSRSTSQSTEIDLLRTIGELALSTYGPLLRAEASGELDTSAQVGAKARLVLEKLAIYFPFGTRGDAPPDVNVSTSRVPSSDDMSNHPQSDQVFYDLGLSYCELASLFVLLGTHDASGGRVVVSPHSPVGQMEQVSDWVIQMLRIDVRNDDRKLPAGITTIGKPLQRSPSHHLVVAERVNEQGHGGGCLVGRRRSL
ncbi:hypothetical protein FRC00_000541 [Tulasnella sp. 408]|nr:hypothetical protein FRC00_000541 [Tulasnella sp. 408]